MEPSSPTPADDHALFRRHAERFEDELETLLKRFDITTFATDLISQFEGNIADGRLTPASRHVIAHAIEAHCAYFRGHRRERVDWHAFCKIFNFYHDRDDPSLLHVAKTDFDLFFLRLARQQLELQTSPAPRGFSRHLRLFVKADGLAVLDDELRAAEGLTVLEWTRLAVAVFTITSRQRHPIQLRKALPDLGGAATAGACDSYLRLVAATPREVGSRYRERRSTCPPEETATLRSVFFEFPLIRYEGDRYFAPFPNLVFRHATSGLYGLLANRPGFADIFGRSVESYTDHLLRQIPGSAVYTAKQLERRASGKSCDFIVKTDKEILLVEVKAVAFRRDFLRSETIRVDGSTAAIQKAILQLAATAEDLRSGRFEPIGIPKPTLPVAAIVVTFGQITFVNAPWYREDIIYPKVRKDAGSTGLGAEAEQAAVLSLEDLESLVGILHLGGPSFAELARAKHTRHYNEVGDWNTFLDAEATRRWGGIPVLPTAREDSDEFLAEFDQAVRG